MKRAPQNKSFTTDALQHGICTRILPSLDREPSVHTHTNNKQVSGFGISHHTGRARAIATAVAEAYPEKYETWFYFDTRGFRPGFLASIEKEITENGGAFPEGHSSSPFCWFEEQSGENNKTYTGIGGRDRLAEWAKKTFAESESKHEAIWNLSRAEPPREWKELRFDCSSPGTAATE